LSAQRGARPTVARARSGSRLVNILQKEVGEVWRVEDLGSELQLALIPENEVLPSVQINLFSRLAERNITPERVKTVCAGALRRKNLRAWRRGEVERLFCFASEDCGSSPTVGEGAGVPSLTVGLLPQSSDTNYSRDVINIPAKPGNV